MSKRTLNRNQLAYAVQAIMDRRIPRDDADRPQQSSYAIAGAIIDGTIYELAATIGKRPRTGAMDAIPTPSNQTTEKA